MDKTDEKRIRINVADLKNLRDSARRLKKAEESMVLLNKQVLEIKDKYLRLAAEFDNYKKRSEKEKQEIFRYGTENLVMQLIPFDDIFESVLKQMENKPSPEIIHQGLQMLKKEFAKILETAGVSKIISNKSHFDANIHEASEMIETSDYDEGQIVEEERAGYMLNGKIIRPSLVKVAKKKCIKTEDDGKNSSACKD
ncbi:MAG TPA: nucleotide exchange factor GrpE [bacterium]|nr:nucleotide exchange factor GrpE [bacterium]